MKYMSYNNKKGNYQKGPFQNYNWWNLLDQQLYFFADNGLQNEFSSAY